MFNKSVASPRKNPLRASRIFVLASQSTLSDVRLPLRELDQQRDRAGHLIANALECLLLAQSERTASARMYDQARQEHAPAAAGLPATRLAFQLSRPVLTAPGDMTELERAINTLILALDNVHDGDHASLARYAVVLGQVARSLGAQESN